MKKYFKILVLILVLSTSRIKGVKAESFYEDNWISGVYANLVDGDFSKPQLMRFIRRRSDNMAVYCITPRVLLYEDESYSIDSVINLTNEQKKRIEELAYFGYGYGNHTDEKWYAITQFMIWKTVEPNMDIFFTDTRGGNRIIRFTDEMNELSAYVENAYNVPYLPSMSLLTNTSYSVDDPNYVISEFDVVPVEGIDVNISGSTLNINTHNSGYFNLNFNKVFNQYSTIPRYYSASRGQKILVPGNISNINYQLDVNVKNSKVTLIKQDVETNELLANATYGIYDDNYNLIKILTTNENGEIYFDNLLTGHYNFLELNAPYGYYVDNTYHDLVVDDEFEYFTLNDEKIKANIFLNKYIVDDSIITPEQNIEFEIYDSNNNLVASINTDNSGCAWTILPFGNYLVHQKNSTEGFDKVKDFTFEVNSGDDVIFYLNDIKIEEYEDPTENKDPDIEKNENSIKEDLNSSVSADENITEENNIENPKTSDTKIYIYIIVGYVSFIFLLYIISSIKKNNKH